LRDALSLLDRCAVEEHITMESVMKIAGVLGNDLLFEISDGVAKGEIEKVLTTLADFHEQSKEMNRVCDQLISHFRNIMICKTVSNPARLLTCSKDELLKYMNAAATFSLEDVIKTTDNLQLALERMKYSASKRAELEMALIRSMPSMKSVLQKAVVKNIPVVEEVVSAPVISAPAKEEKKETPIVEEKVENIPVKEAPIEEKAPEIKEEKPFKRLSPKPKTTPKMVKSPLALGPMLLPNLADTTALLQRRLRVPKHLSMAIWCLLSAKIRNFSI
ncbi:MAG: hypothetical protein IKT35_00410, partial [Clostridia bacterium]|nr:hypothetical protein [Clostridia bacterium]